MSRKLRLRRNVAGADQRNDFQNATLQPVGGGSGLDVSVATYVAVPPAVAAAGQVAVIEYLRGLLAETPAALSFEVEIGKAEGE